jgi:hypothetical protein
MECELTATDAHGRGQRPGPDRSPLGRALRGAYLIFSGTIVLALLLETGWRAVNTAITALGGKRAGLVQVSPENVPYTLHPYFQVLPAPTKDHQRGPFLAGWAVSPPEAVGARGRFRILFLGGSTTACQYPQYVREEIEKTLGPTTIYNLGYDWQCSLHSLYKIWTYADDIRPDLTIDLEVINDFFRGFTPPHASLPVYRPDYSHYAGALFPFWIPGRSRYDGRETFFARPVGKFEKYETQDESLSGLLRSIVRNSAVLHAMNVRFDRPTAPAPGSAPMPEETVLRALPDYERNMRNITSSCKMKGLPVLLLTMPYTTAGTHVFLQPNGFFTNDDVHALSNADFGRGMDRFNEVVLELRDEPAVHVLPLADEIRETQLFTDEVHLTLDGQRREAQIVARYIVDHNLLHEPRNR